MCANLIFALRSNTWVPSPQSIRKWCFVVDNNCAVGALSACGVAELHPSTVSFIRSLNRVQSPRFQLYQGLHARSEQRSDHLARVLKQSDQSQ